MRQAGITSHALQSNALEDECHDMDDDNIDVEYHYNGDDDFDDHVHGQGKTNIKSNNSNNNRDKMGRDALIQSEYETLLINLTKWTGG